MYLIIFIISCFYLHFMYNLLNGYGSFNNYITKNFMKCIYLFFLFVGASIFIMPYKTYNNAVIKVFASLYVSNDFMGLIKVKLSITTKMHHIVSFLLLIYSWSIDFNENNIAQAIFMYTYISAANFGVNLYLALRFMDKFDWLRRIVRVVYLVTFFINIGLQYYILNLNQNGISIYLLLLSMIIIDDIYLLKWLYHV